MKKILYLLSITLLTFSSVQGQIVYKDLGDVRIGGNANVDPVFLVPDDHNENVFEPAFNLQTAGGVGVILNTKTAHDATIENTYSISIPGTAHIKFPKAFSKGESKSVADVWTDLARDADAGSLVLLYSTSGLDGSVISPKLSNTSSDQFILLKFVSRRTPTDTTLHYGWLHLSIKKGSNIANDTIVLHDWAYSDAPIAAGEGLPCASLKINNVTDSLNILGTRVLNADLSVGTRENLVWATSDPAKATINAMGSLKGITNGMVDVYVKVENGSMCASVYDTIKALEIYTPTSLKITAFADSVIANGALQLNALSGTTYSSSDVSIAIVDANTGIVTGVKTGTISIYAEFATSPILYDTFKIKVVCPTEIKISGDTSVTALQPLTLSTLFSGTAWSVSDTSLATIDSSGILTALKGGAIDIYAGLSSSCPTVYDTFSVTIECPTLVIDRISDTISGDTLKLTLIGNPTGANWTVDTSFAGIATIDADGVMIGVKKGYVDIQVSLDACPTVVSEILSIFVDYVASVNESFSYSNFKIYPNPATKLLNIEAAGMNSIQVIGILGNILKTEKIVTDKLNLDVSDLSKGVYFIKVSNEKESFTKKLIIE